MKTYTFSYWVCGCQREMTVKAPNYSLALKQFTPRYIPSCIWSLK